MPMVGGSVAIDQVTEAASGTGLAKALFDARLAVQTLPAVPRLGTTSNPYSAERPANQTDIDQFTAARLRVLNDIASGANADGPAIVAYIQGNAGVPLAGAVAKVTSEVLGRTPNPNNPDVDIQPPGAPVDIGVTDNDDDVLPVV